MTDRGTARAPSARRILLAAGAAATLAAGGPAAGQTTPGAFEIDEIAAERALERALVQQGSLLLPARRAEITPFVSYVRRENSSVGFVTDADGNEIVATIEPRSNEFTAGIGFRAGLPWNAQISASVPYAYTDSDQVAVIGGSTVGAASSSTSGFGDVSLTYSQGLREEAGGWPSLIGSVTWDTDTGESGDGIELGSGFHEIGVNLNAALTQDPLVFSASIGYQRTLEKDDIRPGDQFTFGADTFLAVSPETSLSLGFTITSTDETRVNGNGISGSDQLSATLDLGVVTLLRRNRLLVTFLNVGLTDDAPAFALSASMPIGFAF